MTIDRPIVEMFGDIVAKTEAIILPYLQSINPKIQVLHYEFGHAKEIANTLSNMDATQAYQFQKYPIIALFQDFAEAKGKQIGTAGTVTLQFIIANQTLQGYKAADRYTHNFKPILYPIYEELLRQIAKSPYFQIQSPNSIVHAKIDRLFWGKEGIYGTSANIFKDMLDAIEVRQMVLTVRRQTCTVGNLSSIKYKF